MPESEPEGVLMGGVVFPDETVELRLPAYWTDERRQAYHKQWMKDTLEARGYKYASE